MAGSLSLNSEVLLPWLDGDSRRDVDVVYDGPPSATITLLKGGDD
ncbi:MAG: hypothetical protein AAGD09_05715 [Cyanobacteria bacterium P01_F01_bin.56]